MKNPEDIKPPTKEDIVRFVIEASSIEAAVATLQYCHAIDWEIGGDLYDVAEKIRKDAGIVDYPDYECIVCGKKIERDEHGMIETDATYFDSYGNWPSSVWDWGGGIADEAKMKIWICTECLRPRIERTRIVADKEKIINSNIVFDNNTKEMTYEEFKHYLDDRYRKKGEEAQRMIRMADAHKAKNAAK